MLYIGHHIRYMQEEILKDAIDFAFKYIQINEEKLKIWWSKYWECKYWELEEGGRDFTKVIDGNRYRKRWYSKKSYWGDRIWKDSIIDKRGYNAPYERCLCSEVYDITHKFTCEISEEILLEICINSQFTQKFNLHNYSKEKILEFINTDNKQLGDDISKDALLCKSISELFKALLEAYILNGTFAFRWGSAWLMYDTKIYIGNMIIHHGSNRTVRELLMEASLEKIRWDNLIKNFNSTFFIDYINNHNNKNSIYYDSKWWKREDIGLNKFFSDYTKTYFEIC